MKIENIKNLMKTKYMFSDNYIYKLFNTINELSTLPVDNNCEEIELIIINQINNDFEVIRDLEFEDVLRELNVLTIAICYDKEKICFIL